MSTNSGLIHKFECLRCLQAVEDYLKQDQDTIEAAVDILCDIGDLIDWVQCCVINWRELSSLYQQAECLLLQSQAFVSENDEMYKIIQEFIEAFKRARAATRSHIKASLLQKDDLTGLLELGFPIYSISPESEVKNHD